MKSPILSRILLLSGIAATALLSSCSKDGDSATPASTNPTIVLATASPNITTNTPIANASTSFTVGFTATKVGADLKTIQVKATTGLTTTYGTAGIKTVPTANTAAFTDAFVVQTATLAISATITVVVTDANNKRDSIVIRPQGTNTYTTKLLFTPLANGTAACFLNSATGATFTPAQGGAAASAGIDLGFYYGATNLATLCSPHVFEENLGAGIVDMRSWTVRNNTKIKTTSTGYGAKTPDELIAIYGGGTDASTSPANPLSRARLLTTTSNFTFMTTNNKHGFGTVSAINPTTGSGGSITFDYIVQY